MGALDNFFGAGWAVYQAKEQQKLAKAKIKADVAIAGSAAQAAAYQAAAAGNTLAAVESSKAAPAEKPGLAINTPLLIGGGIAVALGLVLFLKRR